MLELLRDRLSGWGARLSFGALLLVFSEWIVWQTPTTYDGLEWLALAAVYLALSGIMLDLIARLNANDVFSLLLLAGLYIGSIILYAKLKPSAAPPTRPAWNTRSVRRARMPCPMARTSVITVWSARRRPIRGSGGLHPSRISASDMSRKATPPTSGLRRGRL